MRRRARQRRPNGEGAGLGHDGPAGASAGPVWTIEELTGGGREARIRHAGADYRLRITSNGRLILTK